MMSTTTILLIVGGVAIMLLMHRVGHGAHGSAAHAGAHGPAAGEPDAIDGTVTRPGPGSPESSQGTEDEHQGHAAAVEDDKSTEKPKTRHGCC